MTAAPWLSRGGLSVLGVGSALPGAPLDTAALLDRVEARFPGLPRRRAEMVARRMGILTRHVARPFAARVEPAAPGMSNPDLAARAVEAALVQAGLGVRDLGFLVAHTATPAQPLPANVAFVADRLGYAGPHLEVRQACAGFASALTVAFGLLADPDARPVAIVGSETASAFFDPEGLAEADPSQVVNLMQMGDGAGAVILAPSARAGIGVLSAAWSGATGLGRAPGLEIRHGGSDHPGAPGGGPIAARHDYAAVAEHGPALFDAGLDAARAQGVDPSRVTRLLPHQANGVVADVLAPRLGVPAGRIAVHADRVGNTGSAAIWLGLHDLVARRQLRPDDTVLALGAEATKHMHGGFLYTHGQSL